MILIDFSSFTEEEEAMLFYIVNVIFPMELPKMEFDRDTIRWFKQDMFIKKLVDAFPRVKEESYPIYSSMLTKLKIEHKIEKK